MTTKSIPSTLGNPIKDNNNEDDDDGCEKAPVRRKKTTTSSSIPSTRTTIPPVVVCQICQEQSSRYTCPRCYIHTCSLPCCQIHKRDMSCDGRRDLTKYIPLSQMNDTHLRSDFHFLQTATTTMDATRRLWNQMISSSSSSSSNYNNVGPTSRRRDDHSNPSNKKRPRRSRNDNDDTDTIVPPHALLGAVSPTHTTTNARTIVAESSPASLPLPSHPSRRVPHGDIPLTPQNLLKFSNVQLLVLPDFMERHQRNQSHFVISTGVPVLHWTMEICFVHEHEGPSGHSTTTTTTTTKLHIPNSDNTIVLHSIPETITLPDLLEQAVRKWQSTKRHSLRPPKTTKTSSCTTDNMDDRHTWYLKQIPCPAHNPTYIPVATTSTTSNHKTLLKDILRHQTVVEFPTLYLTTTTLECGPTTTAPA